MVVFTLIIFAGLSYLSYLGAGLPFPPFTLYNGTHPFEPLLLAMLLGIVLRLYMRQLPSSVEHACKISQNQLLTIAIMLLGAKINISSAWQISSLSLVMSLGLIFMTFLLGYVLQRLMQLPKMGTLLITIGTAICGSAAVLAAAPLLRAEEHETATAIAIINLLGVIAMLALPVIAYELAQSDLQFSFWAGLSLPSVPHVIVAGFGYSVLAGKWSVLVKLARILWLMPLIFVLQLRTVLQDSSSKKSWWQIFPAMVAGFVAVVIINELGWFTKFQLHATIDFIQTLLMAMAMLAIGMKIEFKKLFSQDAKLLVFASMLLSTLIIISLAVSYFSNGITISTILP